MAGGHTQFTPENLSEMLGLVEGKKLRVLAVTGEKRLAAVPDAPTMKELGYKVVVGTGRGFVMPAGVPKEALAAMEAAMKRVYDSPAWKDFAKRNNFEDNWQNAPNGASPSCGSRRRWSNSWPTSARRRSREAIGWPSSGTLTRQGRFPLSFPLQRVAFMKAADTFTAPTSAIKQSEAF